MGHVKDLKGEITRYLKNKREGEFLAMFLIGVTLFSVHFISVISNSWRFGINVL